MTEPGNEGILCFTHWFASRWFAFRFRLNVEISRVVRPLGGRASYSSIGGLTAVHFRPIPHRTQMLPDRSMFRIGISGSETPSLGLSKPDELYAPVPPSQNRRCPISLIWKGNLFPNH